MEHAADLVPELRVARERLEDAAERLELPGRAPVREPAQRRPDHLRSARDLCMTYVTKSWRCLHILQDVFFLQLCANHIFFDEHFKAVCRICAKFKEIAGDRCIIHSNSESFSTNFERLQDKIKTSKTNWLITFQGHR